MEFVILGLLVLNERTIYEIKKIIEEAISLFYSASFGSINRAVEKMLAKGWISVREVVENGRYKKIYTITPSGNVAFQEWLVSKIPQEKVKEPALTRLFFMGLMEPKERIRILEEYLVTLEETLATLNALEAEAQKIEIPPDMANLANFQLLTLQYGREYYSFNVRWYQDFLHALQKAQSADLA